MSARPLRAFLRRMWWHARFFGQAVLQRDFAHPAVQRLVLERVGISNKPLSDAQMHRAIARSKRANWKDITP